MNQLIILDGDASVYHQAITACDLPDLNIAVAKNLQESQPHNAAHSCPDQVAETFCAHYRRFLSGTPLEHVVDFSRGY